MQFTSSEKKKYQNLFLSIAQKQLQMQDLRLEFVFFLCLEKDQMQHVVSWVDRFLLFCFLILVVIAPNMDYTQLSFMYCSTYLRATYVEVHVEQKNYGLKIG